MTDRMPKRQWMPFCSLKGKRGTDTVGWDGMGWEGNALRNAYRGSTRNRFLTGLKKGSSWNSHSLPMSELTRNWKVRSGQVRLCAKTLSREWRTYLCVLFSRVRFCPLTASSTQFSNCELTMSVGGFQLLPLAVRRKLPRALFQYMKWLLTDASTR